MADIIVEVRQFDKSATSEGSVRGHRVLIDRPEDKGGLDRGPMGGEMLLLALGGCFRLGPAPLRVHRDGCPRPGP